MSSNNHTETIDLLFIFDSGDFFLPKYFPVFLSLKVITLVYFKNFDFDCDYLKMGHFTTRLYSVLSILLHQKVKLLFVCDPAEGEVISPC